MTSDRPFPIKFAFFGSSGLSVIVLDELERAGLMPACIVTTPDKPKGRGLIVTPTVVKEWGVKRNIHVHDPERLDTDFSDAIKRENLDIFIVASYGKIIPPIVIDIPPHKALNIHPSLLPKYRGPSPLQSAMLDDSKHTGVTIMRIDEKMDHGPIVAAEEVSIDEWPTYTEFEELMARRGAQLLIKVLPDWIDGKIAEKEQDHTAATYTKKTVKEDGLLNLDDDPYTNFRKIRAFHEWPGTYFFIGHDSERLRIKITSASFRDGKLTIEKVIPEGRKEMAYGAFLTAYPSSGWSR